MPNELANVEVECLKLKNAVNDNHHQALKSAADAVERGVLAGELLTQWKTMLPRGQFETFVETHFDGSLRTARAYMQAAKQLSSLPKRQRAAVLNQERSIYGLISTTKPASQKADSTNQDTQGNADVSAGVEGGPPTTSGERTPDLGKCPNCAGTKWTEDEDGFACAKCLHPHGEPAGDTDEDILKTQRQKTVKTVEALMRAFDDLQTMLARPDHKKAIDTCKWQLNAAKEWK